jgi:hypothetical protein
MSGLSAEQIFDFFPRPNFCSDTSRVVPSLLKHPLSRPWGLEGIFLPPPVHFSLFHYYKVFIRNKFSMHTNSPKSRNSDDAFTVNKRVIKAFIVNAPCVITTGNILKVKTIYDLVDFLDNLEIELSRIIFLDCRQESDELIITALDLKSKKLIRRSHNINGSVCNWAVTDLFPQSNEEVKINYGGNG